jgi:hypothetical protein
MMSLASIRPSPESNAPRRPAGSLATKTGSIRNSVLFSPSCSGQEKPNPLRRCFIMPSVRWCCRSSGCSGSPCCFEVTLAGVDLRAQHREAARDEVGIRQVADAQRDVDFLVDQVQRFVVEHHLHPHFRMARVELGQQRRDPFDAHRIRGGDAQPTARAALQLADGALGFIQFACNALAMFVVDIARFGQPELARRAMQQLRAEAHLQVLHLAADGGLGKSQRTRRGNETAVFDHLDEDQGVVEIAGHALLSSMRATGGGESMAHRLDRGRDNYSRFAS